MRRTQRKQNLVRYAPLNGLDEARRHFADGPVSEITRLFDHLVGVDEYEGGTSRLRSS